MRSSKRHSIFAALSVAGLCFTGGLARADFSIYVEYNPSGIGSIVKYDSLGNGTAFASGFQFPEGLVQDSLGNFYLVDEFNANIVKVPAAGGSGTILAHVSDPAPYDIAIDVSGNLYVANYVFGTITKYSSTGTSLGTFISSGLSNPDGLAFDAAGNLYVSSYTGASVKKYDSSGTLLATYTTGSGPQGMTFDSSGNLFVALTNLGIVEKFSPTGTDLGAFISGVTSPTDLAFDPLGNLYVTSWTPSTGSVLKYSSTGTSLGTFATGGSPTGILIVNNVPEPGSALLLAMAGGTMLGLRRRRH
ncbi:MAG TPA: SMP-30/gluconolactonase/LRE family protein [Chthoniobacter sp.]|nr:SMP-30/gluconolactonase/LRE family protein [Chthoniobacter sp.]